MAHKHFLVLLVSVKHQMSYYFKNLPLSDYFQWFEEHCLYYLQWFEEHCLYYLQWFEEHCGYRGLSLP